MVIGNFFTTQEIFPWRVLDEIGEYINGLKDGKWGRVHVGGSLKQEEIYKLGKLIEVSDFYLSDGNVFKNETFDNGNGELFDYYEDGNIFSIAKYKNGLLNGMYSEYHTNGKISQSGMYKNGEKSGTWNEYNRRGGEIKRKTYD